jgi:hypothetical protein
MFKDSARRYVLFADLNDSQTTRNLLLGMVRPNDTRFQAREVLQDESNVQPVVCNLCASVYDA